MALRNQPYIPLYVEDYLTDEKLNECSPAAQGVYIKILCLLHKTDEYGTILLKQKDKQNESKILNFASKLSNHLPFKTEIILPALEELIEESVLTIEGDKLFQKRMVRDNEISEKRASAGKKGAGKKADESKNLEFATAKPKAKTQANSEYEYEYEYENINEIIDSLDIFTAKEIQNIFEIYKKNCADLLPLTFERHDRNFLENVKEFLRTIRLNFNYFEQVCKKANKLKIIGSHKIDLKSVLNNHTGIFNDKYSLPVSTEQEPKPTYTPYKE